MKLPKQIKIGGLTYKINFIEGLTDCGSTHFDTQTILINKGQTEERQVSALIHEIIECENELYDLNLSHQTIQTLEAGLFQILNDNFIK